MDTKEILKKHYRSLGVKGAKVQHTKYSQKDFSRWGKKGGWYSQKRNRSVDNFDEELK